MIVGMRNVVVFGVILATFCVYWADSALAYKPEKVTICHATGSSSNPFTTIHTSPNAISGHFNNNGTTKAGHEDDLIFEGEVNCPTGNGGGGGGGGTGPTDMCPNIEGIQESIPAGMVLNAGNCVTQGGGGGGSCSPLPIVPQNFDVQTGTPNDNTLELSWTPQGAKSIKINFGYEDGIWISTMSTDDDGAYSYGGLTNGVPVWFQLAAVTDCGTSAFGVSIDPLP